MTIEALLQLHGDRSKAEKELELADKHGIKIITRDHPDYPPLLKEIHDAPLVLYCKGDPGILKKNSIAIVGTRKYTDYGERTARSFARSLAEAGAQTVSGLARGIDTFAHRSTLEAGGTTVAVLGSGLLNVYPSENQKLSEQIAERGAVISEFPLHAEPEAYHFPRRNRIVSGLSLGTVVIECEEKSGAMITARLAAEQGREVFAVPGPIHVSTSHGPHRLIKTGAKLAETAEDVLEEIPVFAQKRTQQELPLPDSLTEKEQKLLEIIQWESVHIDLLSSKTGLGSGDISEALLNLEMKGIIRSQPGKNYARN